MSIHITENDTLGAKITMINNVLFHHFHLFWMREHLMLQ